MTHLPNVTPRFEEYYPTLASLAKRHVRKLVPSQHIDDVCQETLIALAKHWHDCDFGAGLDSDEERRHRIEAWVFAFAHKTASSFRRGAFMRRWAGSDAEDDEPESGRSLEEQAELDERFNILIELLKPMNEDRRIVFLLKEIDGFSLREIADMMAIPENTVASRVRAAREEIDERMKRMRKSKGPDALLGLLPLATMEDRLAGSVPPKPLSFGAEHAGGAMTAKVAGVALASFVLGAIVGTAGSVRWRREPPSAEASSPPSTAIMMETRPAADTPSPPGANSSPPDSPPSVKTANLPPKAPPRSPAPPAVAPTPNPAAPAPPVAAAPTADPALSAPSDDRLLIDTAERALKNGDLPRARRDLEDHARRFADSQWRGKREELWATLRSRERRTAP